MYIYICIFVYLYLSLSLSPSLLAHPVLNSFSYFYSYLRIYIYIHIKIWILYIYIFAYVVKLWWAAEHCRTCPLPLYCWHCRLKSGSILWVHNVDKHHELWYPQALWPCCLTRPLGLVLSCCTITHLLTICWNQTNIYIICMYVFLSCKACIGAGSSTAQLCPWLVWFTHLRLDMLDEKLYTSWTPALKCWAAGSVIWYLHRILQFMPMLHWFGAYLSFIPLIVSSDHVERPHKVSQWPIDTLIAVSWEVLQPLEYAAMDQLLCCFAMAAACLGLFLWNFRSRILFLCALCPCILCPLLSFSLAFTFNLAFVPADMFIRVIRAGPPPTYVCWQLRWLSLKSCGRCCSAKVLHDCFAGLSTSVLILLVGACAAEAGLLSHSWGWPLRLGQGVVLYRLAHDVQVQNPMLGITPQSSVVESWLQ